MLQNYITENSWIEIERLYEPPFTTIHAESVDGVFTETGDVENDLPDALACWKKRSAKKYTDRTRVFQVKLSPKHHPFCGGCLPEQDPNDLVQFVFREGA